MRILCLVMTLIGLIALPCAGSAQSRVALVIGNSAYQNVPRLTNPVNDASDISESLKRLGFDVRTLTDAGYDDMRRALIVFGQQARGAEFAVIFFAGHGMEIGGENWLIPVDAQLATDLDISNESIGLQSLTRAVSNTGVLGLVILDACRSNPFLPKMQRTGLTRAVDRGFARVEPNDNVLVAYAARDGTTANDGTGRNSPFTSSLLKNIETPGLEITFLFRNVRDDVMAATKRGQQPYLYGSLSKEQIFLRPLPKVDGPREPAATVTSPPAPGRTQEAKAVPPEKTFADKFEPVMPPKADGTIAQRVVLYDEDPADPKGRQYVGTVVWRTEQIKVAGKPDDLAVRADIAIPERKFKMSLSFRRNTDRSLPASHTVELTFLLPKDFVGGGIANVPGILMKSNEQARGTPLAGLAVKVTDGFFLVGLSNVDSDRIRNIQLLKERAWFDIPLVYGNQRRAIIAIEKGSPGERAYAEALTSWGQ
jgi:hypothetical protein